MIIHAVKQEDKFSNYPVFCMWVKVEHKNRAQYHYIGLVYRESDVYDLLHRNNAVLEENKISVVDVTDTVYDPNNL